jgi:hypothetical protein
VARAEDHTGIQRWDPPDTSEDWRVLVGVPFRYVTWQVEDEGLTSWVEVGSDNWVTRRIEVDASDRYTAAASLAEVLAARDTGGIDAVRSYEQVYGVVPEAPLPPDFEQHVTPVGALEFVWRWIAARRQLDSRTDP